MEVYILDSLLRRIHVVDTFESIIWTERYADIGDFELVIDSTFENRSQFTTGTKLVINSSYRVMTVETVEDDTDDEGLSKLTVKGRSLEMLLEDRVAKDTMSNLVTEPTWILSGTPGDVARQMFNDICVLGNLDPNDIIPFMTSGTIFPEDTIEEPSDVLDWEQGLDTLLNAIKTLCDIYDLGFRLVRNIDTSQLYFDIYTGSDRTTQQDILPPVVFSPDFNNLHNTKEFTTVEQAKNVAYVFSDHGFVVVYAPGVDSAIEGFERRVLLVNDSTVQADNPDIPGALTQRGLDELSKNRGMSLFDGEVSEINGYIYEIDYRLGDLVEIRNVDGVISYKRVTEQIIVCDGEGERSYPTLSIDLFAGTGTWDSYTGTTTWDDFTTEHWEDM